MRIKAFIFLLFFSKILCAQNLQEVSIVGNIKSFSKKPYANQNFKIQVIEDFITFQKEKIASGKTDVNGEFSIHFSINKTSFIFISFNKVDRTLFVEPGKTYSLEIRAPMESLLKSVGHFAKDVQGAEIKNSNAQEINALLDSLENTCSNFLSKNISDRKNGKKMEAFLSDLKTPFGMVKSMYFQDYLRYKEAELMFYFYRNKREQFAKKYFESNNNLANNIQKMQVFSSYFKEYMLQNLLIYDKHPFNAAFKKANLTEVLTHVYPSPHASREMRELILLKGISETFNLPYFNHENYNQILNQIIESSTFPIHQKIAKNLQNKVNHLKEGYPSENIIIEKDHFNLYSYKEKYIYLCFFKASDPSFKQQISSIEQLVKLYGKQLQVICISTDLDLKAYQLLKTQYQSSIKFVHYDFQNEILNAYGIEDYRVDRYDKEASTLCYLLSPHKYLIDSPAKNPNAGFAKDFQLLLK